MGVFLALLAALLVFSYSSTPLLRYPDRAIGVGLMHGVDSARRFSIYLTLVAVVLAVWLGCHYGARWLQRVRPSWFSGVRSRLENDTCAMFAAVGSVAVVARVSADQLDHWAPVGFCLLGIGAVVTFALARRLSPWRWYAARPGLASALALIVLLAWPAPQIAGVIGDVRGSERAWLVPLVMFLLPLLYGLGLAYFSWRPGRAARSDVSRAFALGAAPLFAFPGLCPVANEIQYALAQRRVLEPRSIALGLLLLLVAAGALSFWRARAGKLRWAPRHVLARFVFPAIIFGEALLSVYAHTLNIKHVDPLHDGEQITAIHQLLAFDKWPFVDVWPAHGLFDYVGALYSVVNGFHPLEITAWNGLLSALSATAAYAVLASVATPAFAFAVAAVLPIEAILPLPQYSFFYAEPGLLAVGLLACLVLAKPSLRRHVLLALAAFLCFFWTPASGVAAIAGASGLLVLGWITARERRPIARGIVAFATTGAAVFVVYVLMLLLRGQPVLDTLRLIRAYIQADPLIGGYPEMIADFDALAFLQYVILPGIGIIYLAKLARHALERRPLDGAERLLGFLTLISFVLFARTLTRHGITERFQPFYFPLLALCIWMPQRRATFRLPVAPALGDARLPSALSSYFWRRASARVWFCAGLALYVVWAQEPARKGLAFDAFDFHTWKAGEPRFRGEAPAYPRLAAFLGATLRPGDTFLELLNMPVLYGLLDREMPGQFFLPTMFYATDSVQNSYLARLAAFGGSARVPVVLLPDEKGFNIDKIDNMFRSYRIAEHVFREYVPFGKIDGFDVWVSRARWDAAAQNSSPRPLAFREPSSYRAVSVEPPRLEDGVLRITATGADPRVEDVADVTGLSLGGLDAPHAVRFSYRTSVAGSAELFFRSGGSRYTAADSGRVTLVTSPADEWRSAEVAIPAQGDPTRPLTGLRIDPPDGATLEVRDLVLVFGGRPPAEPEKYTIGMLPFFWANFDSRRAVETARVLESIEVPAAKPRKSFALKFRPIDRASGNYLKLCIRLPELDVSTKAKRWTTVDHPGSWDRAGKVTLTFGAAPAGTFVFDLVQPQKGALGIPDALVRSFAEECKPYLVRISSQYAWSSQPISSINVASTVPIMIESASLLAGD